MGEDFIIRKKLRSSKLYSGVHLTSIYAVLYVVHMDINELGVEFFVNANQEVLLVGDC